MICRNLGVPWHPQHPWGDRPLSWWTTTTYCIMFTKSFEKVVLFLLVLKVIIYYYNNHTLSYLSLWACHNWSRNLIWSKSVQVISSSIITTSLLLRITCWSPSQTTCIMTENKTGKRYRTEVVLFLLVLFDYLLLLNLIILFIG